MSCDINCFYYIISSALRDGLSDMSLNTTSQSGTTATDSSQSDLMSHDRLTSSFSSESTRSPTQPTQPYLMTPDAFKSHHKSLPPNLNSNVRDSSGSSSTSSLTHVTGLAGVGISIDELLGSSLDGTRVITPDSSITLTPSSPSQVTPHSIQATPSAIPLPPLTPGEIPLPPMTPGEAPLSRMTPGEAVTPSDSHQDYNDSDNDEGPKSPPPSPIGCTTPEELTNTPAMSSDKLGKLLQHASRRMSESSAEVALIMKVGQGFLYCIIVNGLLRLLRLEKICKISQE